MGFDIEIVSGQEIDMERDLKGCSMYVKPGIGVWYVEVERDTEIWQQRLYLR